MNCEAAGHSQNDLQKKPLILPPEFVQVLRGECGYTEDSAAIAELGIRYYQDGKARRAFNGKALDVPGFSTWCVEMVNRYLLACWERGRKDAGEVSA